MLLSMLTVRLRRKHVNVTTLNVIQHIGDSGKNGENVQRTKRKIQRNGKSVAVNVCTKGAL